MFPESAIPIKKHYLGIGMMSGTSLDGIDISLCKYYQENKTTWNFQFVYGRTYQYQKQIVQLIRQLEDQKLTYLEFHGLEIRYSETVVEVVEQFLKEFMGYDQVQGDQDARIQIKRDDIDFLGMHGHTIFHQPAKGLTVQVSNLSYIAAKLRMDVIGNFRQLDVHCGGQGAPLAPYGEGIFSNCSPLTDTPITLFLNLGGIANLSFNKNEGLDITYCNLTLNYLSKILNGKDYDRDGENGRLGKFNEEFYQWLVQRYRCIGATNSGVGKSLSLAREGLQQYFVRVQEMVNGAENKKEREDIVLGLLNTQYEFIAEEVVRVAYEKIEDQNEQNQDHKDKVVKHACLCTGGGSFNSYLFALLTKKSQYKSGNKKVHITFLKPQKYLIQFKQAIIFGFLGVKYLEGENNCGSGIGGALVKGKRRQQ